MERWEREAGEVLVQPLGKLAHEEDLVLLCGGEEGVVVYLGVEVEAEVLVCGGCHGDLFMTISALVSGF